VRELVLSSSPLQNRVTPAGEMIAVPERGLFMGNRGGRLHRPDKTLTRRRWTSRAWITCALEFKGWRETIMAPNRYTQLFFLDEATAFAAGHRPCALCRRADYLRFGLLFPRHQLAPAPTLPYRLRAAAIDAILHTERLTLERRKQIWPLVLGDLPDGTMFQIKCHSYLWWQQSALSWSPGGYAALDPNFAITSQSRVDVLTPPSIVAVLAAGYRPLVHPSADRAVTGSGG
jgi:hypothetical protein